MSFLTEDEERQVVAAITEAENGCHGEIRVRLERHSRPNVLDSAANAFARLKMHKTRLRNGILFFVATEDHRFAVIGDAGINRYVTQYFWDDLTRTVECAFREGRIMEGLIAGINMCGAVLKKHYPVVDGEEDLDELPNDISKEK